MSLNTASSAPARAQDRPWCSCHVWAWSQPENKALVWLEGLPQRLP